MIQKYAIQSIGSYFGIHTPPNECSRPKDEDNPALELRHLGQTTLCDPRYPLSARSVSNRYSNVDGTTPIPP